MLDLFTFMALGGLRASAAAVPELAGQAPFTPSRSSTLAVAIAVCGGGRLLRSCFEGG
jgi:hypothetical protein